MHNPIGAYAMLEVIGNHSPTDTKIQVLQRIRSYSGDNKGIYERVKADTGNFGNWIRVDNFGCSTLAELKAALAAI